jgi:hypothetical protein
MSSIDTLFGALRDAFIESFGPSAPHEFGSNSLRIKGVDDGNRGVQWNAWIEWSNPQGMSAFLGVNLEGMKYDSWPIARLLSRELRDPFLLEVKERVSDPNSIRIDLQRHAWQASGRVPSYREQYILPQGRTLGDLTAVEWLRALIEAQECLASPDGGRANQLITLKDGRRVERGVTPYINFHKPISIDLDHETMVGELHAAREDLQPLYEFVLDRTT